MPFSRDEYILRNFSKIKHKKWELYVITRIIHLLNDPDIAFVCQQAIRTRNNRRYLTDLCFPGLKLYCEVDELQHSSVQHQLDNIISIPENINQ
jgi:2-polyprenyl-3-methyl-5-hydroxy-6-metoxy-1,4-benzoquinol methylase